MTPADINNFILGATGLVVAYYAYETHKLRAETKKATDLAQEEKDLSLQPLLTLVYDNTGPTRAEGFRMINLGHGVAMDIQVQEFTSAKSEDEKYNGLIETERQVLPGGEESKIDVKGFFNGKADGTATESVCLHLSTGVDIELIMTFRNALGTKFKEKLKKTRTGYQIEWVGRQKE